MHRCTVRMVMCLLLPTVVCLSGCYHPARQKLIGTWQVSLEMTETDIGNMSPIANPFVAAAGQTLLQVMRAAIELDLREDGTLTTTVSILGSSLRRSGTWRFVGASGEDVTVSTQFDDAAQPQEWTFHFQGEDAFQTSPHLANHWQIDRLVTFRRLAQP